MPAFSHLDPGTPESHWAGDARWGEITGLDVRLHVDVDVGLDVDVDVDAALDQAMTHLIVLAAHPDDETLGASGLMRRVHDARGHVSVIIATDGEGSHPRSTTHTPDELRVLRRAEVRHAVRLLAPSAELHFLGLPDGGLRERVDELAGALATIVDGLPDGGQGAGNDAGTSAQDEPARRERVMIVAPWSGDGHRDHRIAAEVAASVAAERGLRHFGYPIWLWHWGTPDDLPWRAARAITLTGDETAAKSAAIAAHASQVLPLSPAAGDEAVVHEGMRAHFERAREVFIDEALAADPTAAPTPARTPTPTPTPPSPASPATATADATLEPAFFDDFYARNPDPWGFETRWYERRKRAILASALPNDRLGRVLEIGCSTGLITQALAARADSVLAIDAAAAAVDAARRRLSEHPHVTIEQGLVPDDWPPGTFETIVLSEVGYYLSAADLQTLIGLAVAALAPGGCVIACHWRHPVSEYPHSGDTVHDALRQRPEWDVLVRHEEADFLIEVFCPAPARSVAEREGLV